MYSVNGIDLPGSQYKELCDLVGLASDEDRAEFSSKTLHPYDDQGMWNQNGVDCYRALYKRGLIDGTPVSGGFVFTGSIRQAGYDFVSDYADLEKNKRSKIWSDRRFQIALSLVTLMLSTVAGWIAGHFD